MIFTTVGLADTAAPVISSVNPFGITVSGATTTWTTNEAAASPSWYGLTEGYGSRAALYSDMATSHGVDLTGMRVGKAYHY